jgi:hypothetical protein
MPNSITSMRRSKVERDRFRHMLVDVVMRQDCGLKHVEQTGKDGGRKVDPGGGTGSPMAVDGAVAAWRGVKPIAPTTSAEVAPRPDEPLTSGEKDELRQVDKYIHIELVAGVAQSAVNRSIINTQKKKKNNNLVEQFVYHGT